MLRKTVCVGEDEMGQRAMSCYLVENVQKNGEAYANKTVYNVPRTLLNEFLLESGCRDYGGAAPAIIDLMRRAVEERKTKS
jgi:hypothetical protein